MRPHSFTVQIVSLAVTLLLAPLLTVHAASQQEAVPLFEDDSVAMLQVFQHVQMDRRLVNKEEVRRETKHKAKEVDEHMRDSHAVKRPNYPPSDFMGVALKLALSQISMVCARWGIRESQLPVLFPATILFAFVILVVRMVSRIWSGSPGQTQPCKSGRRPELEAWNRGIFAWLYVDFVNDWISRWGCELNADAERIRTHSDELRKLGDQADDCDQCYEKFEALWLAEVQEVGLDKASVIKVCCRYLTWRRIILLGAWTGIYQTFVYIGPPTAVALLIRMMSNIYLERLKGGHVEPVELLPATFVATVLCTGIPIGCGISNTVVAMLAMRMSVGMVGAMSCLVYRKAQHLPTSWQRGCFHAEAKQRMQYAHDPEDTSDASDTEDEPEVQHAQGEVDSDEETHIDPDNLNLVQVISSDLSDTITMLPSQICKIFVTLPILCFLIIALSVEIGATILACMLLCACLTIAFYTMGTEVAGHQSAFMFWAGKRLQFLEGILCNIQTIKACGWEAMAEDRVLDLREKELAELKSFYFALGGVWTCILQYPNLCITTSLWGYMLLNGKTQVSNIWVILPLLYTFQSALMTLLAAVPAVVNALPSLLRVQAFLKLHEAPNGTPRSESVPRWMQVLPDMEQENACLRILPDPTLQVRLQGTFSWKECSKPALQGINLALPAGSSLGIIGRVGSGKTSLLMALVGELYPHGDSRISVPQRMALSAQMPCIMDGTLRDNILFTSPFDEERYKACLHASCLFPDLDILPGGDLVPIGSRGISMSEGQKVRVSMARAAYMNAPLILVDNHFSALDSSTGAHIVDHYIFGDLLEGTTRVIVTEPDAECIKRFDQVALLSEGRVVAQGKPEEVIKSNEYRVLLRAHDAICRNEEPIKECTEHVGLSRESPVIRGNIGDGLVVREEAFEGQIQWTIIAYFMKIGGYWNTFLCVFGPLGIMACQLLSKVAVQDWSSQQMLHSAHKINATPSGFTFLQPFMFWWLASILWYWFCYSHGIRFTLAISRHTFSDIIKRLLHAPVDRFYNTMPVERIVNRLSLDLTIVDRYTYNDLTIIISLFWQEFVPFAYIHVLMPVYFTIASIPLYVFAFLIVRRFANAMVHVRYLAHVSKSCMDTCLTEVEMSLSVLRGAQVADCKFIEFMEKLGIQLGADVVTQTFIKRWAIQRLFLLIGFYMTSVVFICIWVPGTLSFGALGLCLANMLQVCVQIEDDMEYFVNSHYQLVCMNRVHDYTKLPQESPNCLEGDNRFTSFTIGLQSEYLTGLVCDKADKPGAINIWREDEIGMCKELVLVQKPGTEEFVAPPGQTLAILNRDDTMLKQSVAWHRLVEVNHIRGDARLIAQELCAAATATGKKVRLRINSGWMADGAQVVIQDLCAGYGDIPRNILTGVSLTIKPCSSVAFVGATGSGKSTLLLCMLRILECRRGVIFINDVDTRNMGLQTLRRAVGLVPQDPVLMNCSVRKILDPFDLFDEAKLWEGLRLVNLARLVYRMPDRLETDLGGDGVHLSFGQRQLFCMARLVVQQPSLILVDEATSALEPKTQEAIQKALESGFPRSTLMMVAHRLETILGFDEAVVMHNGQITEQGPVKELAARRGGVFAKMLAAEQTC